MIAPPVESCLPADTLAAFDTGLLSEFELEQVAEHLGACAACQGALARLTPVPDPLVAAVRRYVRRGSVTDRIPESHADPEFRPTIDFPNSPAEHRDTVGPSGTEPSLDQGTIARRDAPPTDFALTDLPPGLLAPARGPDELGWLASYRVRRELGRGGMGIVFEAEDTNLQRPVALKVMLPRGAADPRNRERFLREARSAAALTHDHIVPVYQVGEDREVMFIAMPLLRGESLQTRLKRESPLPLAEVLRVGRETAAGLAAAHAQRMMHRDIKPDNLWLEATEPGVAFRVKILDFGLARGADEDGQLTNPGGVIGTPAYMAPEQARGEHVDARADIFSLGAVLYRVATGHPAFRGNDIPSLLHAVCYDAPRPPHELNPSVPQPLSDLIMRLLDKAAANRPTAREVVAALAALEESFRGAPAASFAPRAPAVPVESAPSGASESWLAPVPAPARPRRRLVAVAAGLFALFVAVAGVVVIEIIGRDGKKTKIEVADGSGVKIDKDGNVQVTPPPPDPSPPKAPVPAKESVFGLQRELFTDADLKKPVQGAKTVDSVMQWGWGQNRPDARIVNGTAFGARWTGYVKVPKQSEYQFRFVASGGVRVWIDGAQVIDEWNATRTDVSHKVALTSRAHEVKIEFKVGTGRADFAWLWADKVRGGERPVPTSILFPDRDTAVRAKIRDDPVQSDEEDRRGTDAARVNATAFSANGRFVAHVQDYPDGLIELTDRVEAKQPDHLGPSHGVADIAFAPDGSVLVAGCKDGAVIVWETKTWTVRDKLEHAKAVKQVAFAPNGKWFATVGDDGAVLVWDAETRKQKANVPKAVAHAIGWADGGNRLLTLSSDGVPREWNAATGKKETEHPRVGDVDTTAATFTADGKGALIASFQKEKGTGTLRWVELATGKVLGSAPLAVPVGRVAVSRDGRWVATGVSQDWWLKEAKHTAYDAIVLFEVTTDRTVREVHRFAGHMKWVDSLVFSPDGKALASGSNDHSWRLWKLPEPGRFVSSLIRPVHEDVALKPLPPLLDIAPMPRTAFRVGPRQPLRPEEPAADSVNDLAIGWNGTRVALFAQPADANFKALKWNGKEWTPPGEAAFGIRVAVDHQGTIWETNATGHIWCRYVHRWNRQPVGELAFDLVFAPDGRGFALAGPKDADEWSVLNMKTDPAPGLGDHDRTLFVRDPKSELRGVRLAFAPRKDGGALVTLRASGEVHYGTALLSGQKAVDVAADGSGTIYILGPAKNAAGEHPVLRYVGDYAKAHRWEAVPDRHGTRIVGDHKEGFWLLDARGRIRPPR